MRSSTLAALSLMLVCLAAGLAFLFASVPERRSMNSVSAVSACFGLLTPDDRGVSLRGKVTRSTAHPGTEYGYVDLYVSVDDFKMGSQAVSRGGVPPDFTPRGSVENMVILRRGVEPLPPLSQGNCMLANIHIGMWACGPACDGGGYIVDTYQVLD